MSNQLSVSQTLVMAAQHSTTAEFSSRYKFNAKELDQETGWYYYGARYYDPSVSQWLSIDPLLEKYPAFNPYNYTMNNPIMLVDFDGLSPDDLILKGKNAQKVVDLMNSGLGGKYLSMDKNGKVSLNMTEKQIQNLSDDQKGLYDIISQTMDPKTLTEIYVYKGSHRIISGDYNSGIIDIGDIIAFGTSDSVMTKYSVLGHEINEQFEYQQGNHKEYSEEGSSHMNSNKKEKTMNGGWERGKGTATKDAERTKNIIYKNGVKVNTVYGVNATFKIEYSKNEVKKSTTFKVINGNVVPRK